MRTTHLVRVVPLALGFAVGCSGSISSPPPSEGGGEPTSPTSPAGEKKPPTGTVTTPTPTPAPTTDPAPPAVTPTTPAAAPMRRLTREQYQNVVRDLFGMEFPTAARLSVDEVSGGFRSNSGVAIKELQYEQYQQAAEDIAADVTGSAKIKTLLPCAGSGDETACATQLITNLGKRVFRRPLTAAETDRYKTLFQAARKNADFATSAATVVSALLQSPNFLYRPEIGVGTPANGTVALSPYEAATRLSFFLWNTMPDDALFAAADKNELRTAEQVAAQVARMSKDARAQKMFESFVEQWLDLGDLPNLERDKTAYPLFTPALRSALTEEPSRFFQSVVASGDGRFGTLLTGRTRPLNGPLRALYGLSGDANAPAWQSAELPATERAGLLTMASLMTVSSHPDQTSIVRRGYAVRAKFLCTTPPPPPPTLMVDVPPADTTLTARERFAMHRKNPTCANCHTLMDPLGLPFEVFDTIGHFRLKENNKAIDASSELTGTEKEDGAVDGPLALIDRLSRADEVHNCLATQVFKFAFNRLDTPADAPALDSIKRAFRASDSRIPELFKLIATSPAFLSRPTF